VTDAEASALTDGVRTSLATLKDVAGITGSFVCTQNGRLVAREIPALFEDAVLAEAGSRLLRVAETFAAGGDELDAAVVRYGDHKVYLKAITGGLLCVIVAGAVNMPALRMAANLVGRRIAPAVAKAQAEPRPTATRAPQPQARPAQAVVAEREGAVAPPGMRRFRGRAVE
jgi:predicted regulator of Ras-like GTPase activity (Roadblock/LC7/MglB family)